MKIDTHNPRHWLALLQFGLNVLAAVLLRPLHAARRRRQPRKCVVLYGHRLCGNLLALYREMQQPQSGIEPVFLTMDAGYHQQLCSEGMTSVLATSAACMDCLARADAIISGHGLHSMLPLLFLSDLAFFDVWHGIPFKGFDGDDFRVQHRYDEVWVASPSQRTLYIDKFGFPQGIVHATGYARTDQLVRHQGDVAAIKRSIGLDPANCGKLILFAPTWQQDASDRSLLPFGLDADVFLDALSHLAQHCDTTVLLRTHLNSGAAPLAGRERVHPVPFARYPDTESLILASDVLICDWSSIAFDFLLLERPTLFLDVPAPFRKGFSLGPEYRFGNIVGSLDALLHALQAALADPDDWRHRHADAMTSIRQAVYGPCADGKASARCVARLQRHLSVTAAGITP